MTVRAAGYVRVSTSEQVKNGWNLEADRTRIEATIAEQGWERHAIYDDGGLQGDDAERPGLVQMLAEVDQFDVLIIRDLDRLSRNLLIYATATQAFKDAGITVYEFAGDGTGLKALELDSPDGEALAAIKAVFAQMEKAKIKGRVRQAKDARAKAGGHAGGRRPYGYRFPDEPGGPLSVDPIEAQVVRRIFDLAQATSQRKIARILNDEGITAAEGGRWSQGQINRMLGNALYLGKIRRRVGGEWELHDGQHEAIVDEDLFDRVNATRATKERRAGGRPLKSGHLLTRGLLRCGRCGSAMIPVTSYRDCPDVYLCVGRRDHGPGFCAQPQVHRTLIDSALLAQLTSRYFDLDATRDRLRESRAGATTRADTAVGDAERELAKADANLARVKADYVNGEITASEWRELRADLEESRSAALEALTQAQGSLDELRTAGATTDAEEALLRHLADLKQLVSGTVDQAGDIESLRTVIRSLFASIDLVSPEQPFGPLTNFSQGEKGSPKAVAPPPLVIPHDGMPQPAPYWLLPHLRAEAVDLTEYAPIRQQISGPGPKGTRSRSRRSQFSDALYAPIEVIEVER